MLLFQRDIIEKALGGADETGGVDGAEFLQKVVQVAFDIPRLSPKKLEESLDSTVSKIIKDSHANTNFDNRRWAKLFASGIRPYFETLRDVKRFSNALAFHFARYAGAETFDANPIDLIALEVLRQFEEQVYQGLFEAKTLLTGTLPWGPDLASVGQKKEQFEALLIGANRPAEVREILTDLFPPVVGLAAASAGLDSFDQPPDAALRRKWLNDLRVCDPDVFDRYFRFSLRDEDISEADLNSLMAVAGNRAGFVRRLHQINEKGLLAAAVYRLQMKELVIPDESIVPFITGLFDVERELFALSPASEVGVVPVFMQAALLAESVLRRKPVEGRAPVLAEVIGQTKALYIPFVSFEFSDERRTGSPTPFLPEESAKSLQMLCISKIKNSRPGTGTAATPYIEVYLGLLVQVELFRRVDMVQLRIGIRCSPSISPEGLCRRLARISRRSDCGHSAQVRARRIFEIHGSRKGRRPSSSSSLD